MQKVLEKITGWWDSFILLLPNIAIAIIILIASIFTSRLLKRAFLKLITRFSDNVAVNKLLANIITVITFVAGSFIALSVMNLDKTVTSLLAGAGVVGLAIGLAFQDPILNVISGVMMSMRKPFNIGDMVETNGYAGVIQSISLRSTTIKKFTGEDVIIPNKMVIQNPLENYTLTKYRRVDIPCGVGYEDDLEKVQEVASKAIKDHIAYDTSKPVEVFFSEFGDSSINFTLRFWLDMAEQKNYLLAKSDAIIAIKKAFDAEGINIPFPIRTLEIGNQEVESALKQNSQALNSN